MDISAVIPAYNEQDRIEATLERLSGFLSQQRGRFEILVVDDGSRDATAEIAAGFASQGVELIRQPANRGKGAALRRGALATRGRSVFFLDADLPYGLEFITLGLGLLGSQADAVIGARDLPQSSYDPSYPRIRVWSGNLFSILVGRLLPLGIYDTQCGFKGFQGDLLRTLIGYTASEGYTLDIELLLLLRLWNKRIQTLPVRLERHHGSKVRLIRDSLAMVRQTWAIRRRWRRGEYPSAG